MLFSFFGPPITCKTLSHIFHCRRMKMGRSTALSTDEVKVLLNILTFSVGSPISPELFTIHKDSSSLKFSLFAYSEFLLSKIFHRFKPYSLLYSIVFH